MKDGDGVDVIAERLRQYLLAHPAARDTEDGIAEFWLAGAEGVSRNDVRCALRVLESEGLLRRVVRQDGTVLFVRRIV